MIKLTLVGKTTYDNFSKQSFNAYLFIAEVSRNYSVPIGIIYTCQ